MGKPHFANYYNLRNSDYTRNSLALKLSLNLIHLVNFVDYPAALRDLYQYKFRSMFLPCKDVCY